MVGDGRTISVAGLSLPLVQTLGAPVGAAGSTIGMVGNGRAISIAGLSLPLVKTLGAPVGVAGSTIGMVGNGRTISIAGLCSYTASNGKNDENFCCHGVVEPPSSVKRMIPM